VDREQLSAPTYLWKHPGAPRRLEGSNTMKKTLLSALMLGSLSLVACGDDDTTPPEPAQPVYNTVAAVSAAMDGKTWLMEGTNIPAYPQGIPEGMNLGPTTQCYHKVTMTISGNKPSVSPELGTLRDAPSIPTIGTCDRATVSGTPSPYVATEVLVENVAADGSCFDVLYTYPSFAQEGRGKLSADGKTLTLEIFFKGKAQNAKCANGPVGTAGVLVDLGAGPKPLLGNAQQVYVAR
jgi:hypothetical protein